MAEHANVVDRADSLMRRRRSFVATPANKISPPAPAVVDEDDLPVLTEVVSPDAAVSAASGGPGERFDEAEVALLASDLADAIEHQLSVDLPSLLETALLNAAEELRAGLGATMEAALHDFIARRKQLRLPLDEPDAAD